MTTSDRRRAVTLTVNGAMRTVRVAPMARLLDVLRDDLGLTGTKEGCGEGECGACSVLLGNGARQDGVAAAPARLVNSCLVPIAEVEGLEVTTVEGLADGDALSVVQAALLEAGGAQCGICTPGMVVAATDLLRRHLTPALDDVRQALAGNLCRCTGYTKIFDAVLAAAATLRSRS